MLKQFIHKAHWNIRHIADFLTNLRILCVPYSLKNALSKETIPSPSLHQLANQKVQIS